MISSPTTKRRRTDSDDKASPGDTSATSAHANASTASLSVHIPKRGARACTACRKGKNRCEGGEAPCRRCQQSGTLCVFEKPEKKNAPPLPTNTLDRISRLESQYLLIQSTVIGMQSSVDRILSANPSIATACPSTSSQSFSLSPIDDQPRRFPPLPGFAPPPHKYATYGIIPSTAPSSDDESEDTLPRATMNAPIEALQGLANAAAEAAAAAATAPIPVPPRVKKRRKAEPIPRNAFPSVLEKGLVSESEAQELYHIFFSGCHLFIPLFDPSYDTYQALKERTPFCFDAILAVASKIRSGNGPPTPTFFKCLEEAQGIARSTLFGPIVRKEAVQAMLLLSAWSTNGWLPCGHAMRMALDLGLHRALDKLADSLPERNEKMNGLPAERAANTTTSTTTTTTVPCTGDDRDDISDARRSTRVQDDVIDIDMQSETAELSNSSSMRTNGSTHHDVRVTVARARARARSMSGSASSGTGSATPPPLPNPNPNSSQTQAQPGLTGSLGDNTTGRNNGLSGLGLGLGLGMKKRSEEEERDLVVSARIWLCLYWFDHQLSLGTGRPIVLRNDNSIQHCRLLLSHPMSSPTDVRLVAQIELIMQKTQIYETLSPLVSDRQGNTNTTNASAIVSIIHRAQLALDKWWAEWDKLHASQGHPPTSLLRKILSSELHYAKLWLVCVALRGASWDKLPFEQREMAFQAKEAASRCVEVFLGCAEYRAALRYAVHDSLVTAAFSGLFLLKMAHLFPAEADIAAIVMQVEQLAGLLSDVAAERYALTLRLMLLNLRRKMGIGFASSEQTLGPGMGVLHSHPGQGQGQVVVPSHRPYPHLHSQSHPHHPNQHPHQQQQQHQHPNQHQHQHQHPHLHPHPHPHPHSIDALVVPSYMDTSPPQSQSQSQSLNINLGMPSALLPPGYPPPHPHPHPHPHSQVQHAHHLSEHGIPHPSRSAPPPPPPPLQGLGGSLQINTNNLPEDLSNGPGAFSGFVWPSDADGGILSPSVVPLWLQEQSLSDLGIPINGFDGIFLNVNHGPSGWNGDFMGFSEAW